MSTDKSVRRKSYDDERLRSRRETERRGRREDEPCAKRYRHRSMPRMPNYRKEERAIDLAREPLRINSRDIPRAFNKDTTFPYDSGFVRRLFGGLHTVFIGDSMSRALYKDLLTLLEPGAESRLIWDQDLRNKLEPQFKGDRMTTVKTDGDATDFMEVREYRTPEHLVHFYFTTRVFKEKLENFIVQLRRNPPDVVLMQSCIWDQSRYDMSAEGHMEEYAKRLGRLCRLLSNVLPPTTTFVFLLLPPAEEGVANKGFLGDPRVRRYHKEKLNWHMRLANFVAAQVITSFGYDVCDLLPHFDRAKLNIFREPDGVHFNTLGTRIMTQFIVAHLVDAWNIRVPAYIRYHMRKLRRSFDAMRLQKEYTTRSSRILDHQRAFFKFMHDKWKPLPSAYPITQIRNPVDFLCKFLHVGEKDDSASTAQRMQTSNNANVPAPKKRRL